MDNPVHLHLFGWDALAVWRLAALREARFLRERDIRWQQGIFDCDELPDTCATRIKRRRNTTREIGKIRASSGAVRRISQEYGLDLPLDVSVSERNQRRQDPYVRSHLFRLDDLAGQSVLLEQGLFLPLPHIALLQCARYLDDVGFALLASEMLSLYSIDDERGELLERSPLTSVESIERTLWQMEGLHGVKGVRRMMPYLCGRSRSPRETALALAICLPYHKGGYGLPRPLLNEEVSLSKSAKEIYGKASLECDLCWPRERVAVFYESDAFHGTVAQMSRDSRRNSALAASGYSILLATNQQLKTLESTNVWMKGLAGRLGKRIRPSVKDYPQKQFSLRKRLF